MNQVLTCKVCDESFPSLKELSAHIQKTSHFKDNLLSTGKADSKLDKDRQSPSGLSTTSSTSTTGGLSTSDHQLSNGNQQKKRNSSNGSSNNQTANNNGSKEKRKKSLPVRKLLELERNVPVGSNGQSTLDNSTAANSLSKSLLESMNRLFGVQTANTDKSLRNGYNLDALSSHSNDESENSLNINNGGNQQSTITCDECKESLDVNQFIIHLKHCKPSQLAHGGQNAQLLNLIVAAAQQQQEEQEKAASLAAADDNKSPVTNVDDDDQVESDHKLNGGGARENAKAIGKETSSPERSESRQSVNSNVSGSQSNRATPQLNGSSPKSSSLKQDDEKKSGSVLSALEQLIEKSFDSKSKKNTNNQGILQRLGIDEEICIPPWQNLANTSSPPAAGSTTTNAMLPNTGSFFPWSP